MVEGEQAEAFAKAIRYFPPRRQQELRMFLGVCLAARAERPLTQAQRRERVQTVKRLKAVIPDFELPRSFAKRVDEAASEIL